MNEQQRIPYRELAAKIYRGTRCQPLLHFGPPRILIPKLTRSRDAWKAKATQRKAQRKALQIRVRDLTVSRESHRQRADLLQQQVHDLQMRLFNSDVRCVCICVRVCV